MSTHLAILAVTAAALASWTAAHAAAEAPSLTLYSGVGFQGRQITYGAGSAGHVSSRFKARSAYSTGAWILCDGAGAKSHCQTLNGPAALLKLEPRVVKLAGPAPASHAKPVPAAAPAKAAAPAAHRPRPIRTAAGEGVHRHRRRGEPARVLRTSVRRHAHTGAARVAAEQEQVGLDMDPGATPVAYSCQDGRTLTVLFDPERETAEIRAGGEAPVVLARTDSPEGFRYESWGRAFYGEGDEAAYQIGGASRLDCWTARSYER